MASYLFVCLGNICRSPLAQGIAENYSNKHNLNLVIDSAGTSNYHSGENPCFLSINIAKKYNIDISNQISRQITKKDFTKFDYVIALDSKNFNELKKMDCKNLLLLGEYGCNAKDIPDPYYYQDKIDIVWDMINTCVTNLITKTNH